MNGTGHITWKNESSFTKCQKRKPIIEMIKYIKELYVK